ncbi:Recombination protein RecR [Planctomycetales bacterium 10988]|nr:Recombination protein RecR [Planctomycetales bacterium 10988]
MASYGETVNTLIEQFARLPGIGRKSAERLAYHLLRVPPQEAFALADAIRQVRERVQHCEICYMLAEESTCEICQNPNRDTSTICIVEQPRDVMALEQIGTYKGLYHVLLGRIAPLDGVGPEDLTIEPLVERVQAGTVEEIIMATNPTVEGDGTALYISNRLQDFPVKVTRLARGINAGTVLEYANREMLSDALNGRQAF